MVGLVAEAGGVALRPAVDQATRPAAEQLAGLSEVAILAGDVARAVDRVDAIEARHRGAGGAPRIERVERPHYVERGARAVVEGRALAGHARPAVEQVVVGELQHRSGAVDRARALQAERGPGARQVRVLERKAAGILAAGAAHLEPGLQGPGIARLHLEVDDAVAIGDRRDRDLVDRAVAADQALGLFDQAHRDALAAAEEEQAPDQGRPRLHVQRVRYAIGQPAFLRILELEDVLRIDDDLADDGAGRFELVERRDRLRSHPRDHQCEQPRQQVGFQK